MANFSKIPYAITKVETSRLSLAKIINVFKSIKNIIQKPVSLIGKTTY
jgi:hypothetical protein